MIGHGHAYRIFLRFDQPIANAWDDNESFPVDDSPDSLVQITLLGTIKSVSDEYTAEKNPL